MTGLLGREVLWKVYIPPSTPPLTYVLLPNCMLGVYATRKANLRKRGSRTANYHGSLHVFARDVGRLGGLDAGSGNGPARRSEVGVGLDWGYRSLVRDFVYLGCWG